MAGATPHPIIPFWVSLGELECTPFGTERLNPAFCGMGSMPRAMGRRRPPDCQPEPIGPFGPVHCM
jgi:hypothetical protein